MEGGYANGKLDAVRNSNGIWINTSYFKEAGNYFTKHGVYTAEAWGTKDWYKFWQTERERCINGYTVAGTKITGEHYFYLNYCPIQKAGKIVGNRSTKIRGFPDFWDGDYNYFWTRQIAKKGLYESLLPKDQFENFAKTAKLEEKIKLFESLHLMVKIPFTTNITLNGFEIVKDNLEGGFNMIVGKSRRKGYTLKNSSISANNYLTVPNSYTAFGAFDKKFLYPKGIFAYTVQLLNFINTNTGWAMQSSAIKKVDHIRASYYETGDNGIEIEKGFMSEIQGVTFKHNPDALRGKDALDIFIEEAGAFGTPGLLKDSYSASQNCVLAGSLKTGMITLFGTSGDMKKGTADYADMMLRPEAFDLIPFYNIWDEGGENMKVGFFHPVNWNMEGFYDEQGNSDAEGARTAELLSRAKLQKNGATQEQIYQKMQENPMGPMEAFGSISNNGLPIADLRKQVLKVRTKNRQVLNSTPVDMFYDKDGKLVVKPILDGSAEPITGYYNVPKNRKGCVLIYEQPVDNAPFGAYKIGYDPVMHNEGTSLAGILVKKGFIRGSYTHSIIVAEYIGRRELAEDMDKIAEMLAIYYNTNVMHENNVPGTLTYFKRKNKVSLLALRPDKVISKNVKDSRTQRNVGVCLIVQLKIAGLRYIKDDLLKVIDHDRDGNPIRFLDTIDSLRLLEELISYNLEGNFDLVSAYIMCLFQEQEEIENKIYDTDISDTIEAQLDELAEIMHGGGLTMAI